MASFVLNSIIIDDDTQPISVGCTFKFFHYNTNKLSSLRETTLDNQLVFDTDDADINNQVQPFKSGDKGIVFASTIIDNIDYFSAVVVTSTGADTYVFDIELKSSIFPTVSFNNGYPNNCLVNKDISIQSTSSDEYQWTYKNNIHYHKNNLYGITMFPKVGIKTKEYKITKSDDTVIAKYSNYQTSNTFNLSENGYYKVYIKVVNNYNQETIVQKTCYLYLNIPTISINHTPLNPMSKQDYNINVIYNNFDNNIISSTLYKITNNVSTGVKTSTTNDYNITLKEDLFNNTLYYRVDTVYNNGLENVLFSTNYNIQMQLRPSILTLESNINSIENDNDGDTDWIIKPIIDYGDGAFAKLTYSIYFFTPFNNNRVLVDTIYKTDISDASDTNNLDLHIEFKHNGVYEIIGTLLDEFNGTSNDSVQITIDSSGLIITEKEPMINVVFDRE